jgi:hypothetical protein
MQTNIRRRIRQGLSQRDVALRKLDDCFTVTLHQPAESVLGWLRSAGTLLPSKFISGVTMSRTDDMEDPRRRLLVQSLSLGILGAAVYSGPGWGASILGERPGKLPPNQSIYRMSGSVVVNDRPATPATQIKPGDKVQTGKNSELVFVVGTQATILRSESQLELQQQQSTGAVLLNGFRLLTGKMLSVFAPGRPMNIQTPTSTIGIRGTGIYLEADPEQTYFCTCYGTTDIQAVADPNAKKTVQSRHHDEPVYILARPQGGKTIVAAPFINHTDQELMLIETLVGREPPFVFPSQDYGGPRKEY